MKQRSAEPITPCKPSGATRGHKRTQAPQPRSGLNSYGVPRVGECALPWAAPCFRRGCTGLSIYKSFGLFVC